MTMILNQSVRQLNGIGPALAEKLERCGIFTLQDLLFHLPFRYQDRTRITPIRDLREKDWSVVTGKICKTEVKKSKRGNSLLAYLEDKTGILRLRFFHYHAQQLKTLEQSPLVRVFGEVHAFGSQLEMVHPEYKIISNGIEQIEVEETLTPIYSTTQGLSQTRLRQMVKRVLSDYSEHILQLEWMTKEELTELKFQSLSASLHCLHYPPPETSLQTLEEGHHPALQRLAFDELLAERLSLQLARHERAKHQAPHVQIYPEETQRFKEMLPFALTTAQNKVVSEIYHDMSQPKPMLRLVQGDVGSGKTVISALASLQVIKNGYQVALMAPTELLCDQHAQNLTKWFAAFDIQPVILRGKMKAKERRDTLQALATNRCQMVVGTHALFQENVQFFQLGLIIIDEQHRFGVNQRLLLQQKNQHHSFSVHQLLLTATPIPRTLAMTQYAHLDLSVIDELPPDRTPVITAVMEQSKRPLIIERLRAAFEQGRQAYWVCTLIEDSEKLQCMAAIKSAESLQQQLPNARIGLVHGRMKAAEKESIMLAFKEGSIDLLVATTVIEVGVDVPNASLMIIDNAERLGLSQLHQLRGRVGRGSVQSHCVLVYQAPLSHIGIERLRILRSTADGFVIAEKDLELRGRGEMLGTRQTGYKLYKIANLQRDQQLLPLVQRYSAQLTTMKQDLCKRLTKQWRGDYEPFLHT